MCLVGTDKKQRGGVVLLWEGWSSCLSDFVSPPPRASNTPTQRAVPRLSLTMRLARHHQPARAALSVAYLLILVSFGRLGSASCPEVLPGLNYTEDLALGDTICYQLRAPYSYALRIYSLTYQAGDSLVIHSRQEMHTAAWANDGLWRTQTTVLTRDKYGPSVWFGHDCNSTDDVLGTYNVTFTDTTNVPAGLARITTFVSLPYVTAEACPPGQPRPSPLPPQDSELTSRSPSPSPVLPGPSSGVTSAPAGWPRLWPGQNYSLVVPELARAGVRALLPWGQDVTYTLRGVEPGDSQLTAEIWHCPGGGGGGGGTGCLLLARATNATAQLTATARHLCLAAADDEVLLLVHNARVSLYSDLALAAAWSAGPARQSVLAVCVPGPSPAASPASLASPAGGQSTAAPRGGEASSAPRAAARALAWPALAAWAAGWWLAGQP